MKKSINQLNNWGILYIFLCFIMMNLIAVIRESGIGNRESGIGVRGLNTCLEFPETRTPKSDSRLLGFAALFYYSEKLCIFNKIIDRCYGVFGL